MNNEVNKKIINLYFEETWVKGNWVKEDHFVSPDVIVHTPPPPGQPVWLLQTGFMLRAALPDFQFYVPILFGDGERVVQNWHVMGTHTGAPLYGVPASGKRLMVSGVNIFRLADSRIVERWGNMDMAGLMQQLHS
jgi:predicted ester cyclase